MSQSFIQLDIYSVSQSVCCLVNYLFI